jgi:hypothetical protein
MSIEDIEVGMMLKLLPEFENGGGSLILEVVSIETYDFSAKVILDEDMPERVAYICNGWDETQFEIYTP